LGDILKQLAGQMLLLLIVVGVVVTVGGKVLKETTRSHCGRFVVKM